MSSKPLARINQTAYRVLLLLHWLTETPLTADEINQRFLEHPDVQRQVSQDTIWLYINTLKSVGCQISRPSQSNGYTYQLTYHPFAHFLTQEHIDCLQEMVHVFDNEPDCAIVVPFNRWLQRVLQTSANINREDMAEQFFSQMRLVELAPLTPMIVNLIGYCLHSQLIEVTYESATKGLTSYTLLPSKVIHYDGQLYLTGISQAWEETAMFRLDKIKKIDEVNDTELQAELKVRKANIPPVRIRLFNCTPEHYTPFSPSDTIISYDTESDQLDILTPGGNLFLLKQKLLSSGYLFQVVSPEQFRDEVQQTVETMRAFYE